VVTGLFTGTAASVSLSNAYAQPHQQAAPLGASSPQKATTRRARGRAQIDSVGRFTTHPAGTGRHSQPTATFLLEPIRQVARWSPPTLEAPWFAKKMSKNFVAFTDSPRHSCRLGHVSCLLSWSTFRVRRLRATVTSGGVPPAPPRRRHGGQASGDLGRVSASPFADHAVGR
jgi:hypothetical protein